MAGAGSVTVEFQSTPPRGRRLRSATIPVSVVSIHASAREATTRSATPSRAATFQSTPPRGRRPDFPDAARRYLEFQSTPPRGRRPGRHRRGLRARAVSIHASAREATQPADAVVGARGGFQSTPPRGRRPSWSTRPSRSSSRFNPRLRAGGDVAGRDGYQPPGDVSIHASAREATIRTRECSAPWLFQSTPPRGRRRPGTSRACRRRSFNPRLRAGGDARDEPTPTDAPVSIHASAREATVPVQHAGVPSLFQSTPPRGRRPIDFCDHVPGIAFQSTPPRGRRPAPGCEVQALTTFQSTPPRGRRPTPTTATSRGGKFQSTPPRGRRPGRSTLQIGPDMVSIHASAREATRLLAAVREAMDVSIHASAREATVSALDEHLAVYVSIHASAREATASRCISTMDWVFQSTPPRGRRPRPS